MLRRILNGLLLAALALQIRTAPAEMGAGPAPTPPPIELRMYAGADVLPPADDIVAGAVDENLAPFDYYKARATQRPFWLELRSAHAFTPSGAMPALLVHKGWHLDARLFVMRAGRAVELPRATLLPRYRGTEVAIFVAPDGVPAGTRYFALMTPVQPRGSEELAFSWSTLDAALARGAEQARMITLSFGALMAIGMAALLIWFILRERLILYYAGLISMQALYVAYVSGFGFDWPYLSAARPLLSHAWNVPAAVAGGIACLFAREIAQFRRYLPALYSLFGWLGVAFMVLALSNFVVEGAAVVYAGNAMFLFAAPLTIVAAFVAWRRGSRAAGWFLLAWLLLETYTIATAMRLILSHGEDSDYLLYYGLPLSMVAASVLIALGLADRMREQRVALSEAERHAQTDPLTGVLNRRSLLERLEVACSRAQTRELPISVLFIDLDHFKRINDSCGHAAGDACLRAVVAPIHAELRQSDVIGRYGGEEFVVILSSAGEESARPVAERIVQRVAALRVEGFGVPIQMTCSIGVAASDTLGVWGEALISRADAAVYAAKDGGRNRVELANVVQAAAGRSAVA